MHKVLLTLVLVGYVYSARLDNLQYLPPQGNSIQGSSQSPAGFSKPNQQPDQSYGAPGSQGPQGPQGQPSNQYGVPGSQGSQGLPSNQYGAPGANQYPEQPRSPLADVPIVRLDSENPGDGTYRYAYETGNDIAAQEEGSALSGWNKAQGSYRFVSPEGQNFEITYTADENGYNPQGAHLPTPPPIPEAILKSLEVIRQAEASGQILEGAYQPEGDDGQYHEGHDEGQYPASGVPAGKGGAGGDAQGYKPAPQGFQPQGQGYPSQQQPVAPNGGYRY